MADLSAIEIKAFVPARDFALAKQFYLDLGFKLAWTDDSLAYFHVGDCSFLLQNYFVADHAAHFMMHMLVPDVELWWRHIEGQQIAQRYNVHAGPPEDRPWGIRDLTIADPTGVLWRIGHAIRSNRA